MQISLFYWLLLVIRYPFLLCRFRMYDEVLDQSGMGAIFIGNGADEEIVFYDRYEC